MIITSVDKHGLGPEECGTFVACHEAWESVRLLLEWHSKSHAQELHERSVSRVGERGAQLNKQFETQLPIFEASDVVERESAYWI